MSGVKVVLLRLNNAAISGCHAYSGHRHRHTYPLILVLTRNCFVQRCENLGRNKVYQVSRRMAIFNTCATSVHFNILIVLLPGWKSGEMQIRSNALIASRPSPQPWGDIRHLVFRLRYIKPMQWGDRVRRLGLDGDMARGEWPFT